jgi:hypothetical protein
MKWQALRGVVEMPRDRVCLINLTADDFRTTLSRIEKERTDEAFLADFGHRLFDEAVSGPSTKSTSRAVTRAWSSVTMRR